MDQHTTVFRTRDIAEQGLTLGHLRTLVRSGAIVQAGRGLYQWSGRPFGENITMVQAVTMVPTSVVCLLTALRYHGLGTSNPAEVWLAIDRKARLPKAAGLPVHIVRFAGRLMSTGVETRAIEGVAVRITGPARTVVDTFRYRNKIGLDVALEALRDGLRRRTITRAEVRQMATTCGAASVLTPYLQAMS